MKVLYTYMNAVINALIFLQRLIKYNFNDESPLYKNCYKYEIMMHMV